MAFLLWSASSSDYLYDDGRRRNITPPPEVPSGSILYRADGAARGQGTEDGHASGFGCICYASNLGPQACISRQLPEDHTNNMAEYAALVCCLMRIARQPPATYYVQMDSLLVCRQVNGQWRRRSGNLHPFFNDSQQLVRMIQRQNSVIHVVHIYREWNGDADSLANTGADGRDTHDNWF